MDRKFTHTSESKDAIDVLAYCSTAEIEVDCWQWCCNGEGKKGGLLDSWALGLDL
jgi:hypothetical protein